MSTGCKGKVQKNALVAEGGGQREVAGRRTKDRLGRHTRERIEERVKFGAPRENEARARCSITYIKAPSSPRFSCSMSTLSSLAEAYAVLDLTQVWF